MAARLRIWCVGDGRKGHENQIRGLLKGLEQQSQHSVKWLQSTHAQIRQNLRQAKQSGDQPDLVIGAGRRTHWPLLRAGFMSGAKTLVLMNPGIIRPLFDLCIIPEHDGVVQSERCIISLGALNTIEPAQIKANSGMVLLGGPGKHFNWDEPKTIQQIREVLKRTPKVHWQIVTSSRTPDSIVKRLSGSDSVLIRPEDAAEDWLAREMPKMETIWTSADSVSMLSEALSTNARCGVLELSPMADNRVTRFLESCEARGRVTSYSAWLEGSELGLADQPLQEATRCASVVLERLG